MMKFQNLMITLIFSTSLFACGKPKSHDEEPQPPKLNDFVGYWAGALEFHEADAKDPKLNPRRCVQKSYEIRENFVGLDITLYNDTDCETLATTNMDFLRSAIYVNAPDIQAARDGFALVTGDCRANAGLCPKTFGLALKLSADGKSLQLAAADREGTLDFTKTNPYSLTEFPEY